MSNEPKNVRCPFCGKFMYLSVEGVYENNILYKRYCHTCGPEEQHRYVAREFWSADGENWFYVDGSGSYDDFLSLRHTWTERRSGLSNDATKVKLERWSKDYIRAYKLKVLFDEFSDLDAITLYDKDAQSTMKISYVNKDTGVIFLEHTTKKDSK